MERERVGERGTKESKGRREMKRGERVGDREGEDFPQKMLEV